MTSLKKQTVSGVKWVLVTSIIQRILSFGATVILARILTPADFGLFALAFVMIDGFQVFKSLGFDTALVRRKEDINVAANTAFFLIPSMGVILFLILLIIAPIGAKFLNNDSVANIIRALAIIFVISCFGKVPQTILYRDMKFKFKSIAEIYSTLIYVLTAVILALNKFGVWSLVIAYILRNLIQISIEWYFSGWKPNFEFNKKIALEMFHFGKFVLGGSLVWFLYSNLDNLLVGKLLGITMLGFYGIARNTSNLLNDYLFNKTGLIMYPAYSKIQESQDVIRNVMLKTFSYVSTIALPFHLVILIFAPDILLLVFGEKWLPATDILRVLAIVGIFRALNSVIWPALLARGKAKADFQVNLFQLITFSIFVIPLTSYFKLVGVGIAVLLATIISFGIGLFRIKKAISVSYTSIFNSIRPALTGSLLMVFIILLTKNTFHRDSNGFVSSFYIILSFIIFFLLNYSTNYRYLIEIKNYLKNK